MIRVLVDLLSYTGTKGGMETYTRELYAELGRVAQGYEFVGFASKELLTLDHSWFPGEIVPSGISGENRFHWAYGELFAVARAARRHGADLIHSPATLGPRRSSVPTVVTMHDMLYWSHPDLMSTPFYTRPVMWMEKQVSKNAARVLTISDVSAGEIQKYLGVDPSRIDMVPLAGTAPKVQAEPGPREPDLLIAMGNRRPHKNYQGLVRAMALVDESVRPRLVVTGSRGDDPLLPIVEELGLERWVELKGWVTSEELEALYSKATALVMPTFCEGFGLPPLEAMMVGLPVLMSDLPVLREVGGDAALYFDPHDLSSIAGAITQAVTSPELLGDLAQRGYARAALYSWEKVARGTLESFEKALAAR